MSSLAPTPKAPGQPTLEPARNRHQSDAMQGDVSVPAVATLEASGTTREWLGRLNDGDADPVRLGIVASKAIPGRGLAWKQPRVVWDRRAAAAAEKNNRP